MDQIQLFFYTKVIIYTNMGLQPLEKNNNLARYIQKECKIELFSIQRVIPLRDDETNLELQVTLVDTKLIACVFHSVLIQHAYLCVDRAMLERPAYLCVDRSDITMAGVCSCWRGVDEQRQRMFLPVDGQWCACT